VLLAVAFTLLPTVFAYRALGTLPAFKSQTFKLAFAWFLGQYVSTLVIFLLSILFVLFTDRPLYKASVVWLLVLVGLLSFLYRSVHWPTAIMGWRTSFLFSSRVLVLILCLAFSVLLYSRHLLQVDNQIFTSPMFWDFNIHFPIIQNFVYGNNFPPENESFSGFPMTYHYFFDLLTAIYSALGLGLVLSMNYVSIAAFFMMLVAIIGISEELFSFWQLGVFSVVLTLTSSSLRFYFYLTSRSSVDPWDVLVDVVSNKAHPYFFSFIERNPYGYNGSMFNIFYFISERQMVLGVVFLICSLWLFFRRRSLPPPVLVVAGLLIGLFLQWHLFITISVIAAAVFLFLIDYGRKETAFILLGALPVLGLQYIYFSFLTSTPAFSPEVKSFPRLSLDFPTMTPEYPFSLANATGYYIFAYGAKFILAPLGLYFLARKNRAVFAVVAAVLVPTFILINTIQLSPLSVWDNHKWLRPMNVVVDLVVAYVVFHGLFLPKVAHRQLAFGVLLPLLIASGAIELMPFLNSKPANAYALYPSPTIDAIRSDSEPHSAFLSVEAKELHLAGRKLFSPNPADEPGATSFADSARMNRSLRELASHEIYAAPSRATFCALVTRNPIDFVEFNQARFVPTIFSQLADFPQFSVRNDVGEPVVFVNARAGCQAGNGAPGRPD
jgi:hypothetical protein